MRIGLPFSCSFVGKSWYVLVMSMIRYGAYVRSTLPEMAVTSPFFPLVGQNFLISGKSF
jgi:hypothetical protein